MLIELGKRLANKYRPSLSCQGSGIPMASQISRGSLDINMGFHQWCIAKNGRGYTQRGVAKGLTVPCLFMITEVSIRCQKNPEVGVRRIPAYK